MSYVIDADKVLRQVRSRLALRLDRIKDDDLQRDPKKVVRTINQIVDALNALEPAEEYADFEGVACTSNGRHELRHGFGAPVRWRVVGWTSSGTPLVDSSGDTVTVYSPMLTEHADTDENTLVLTSRVAGTATVRVTPRGY